MDLGVCVFFDRLHDMKGVSKDFMVLDPTTKNPICAVQEAKLLASVLQKEA